MSNLSEHRTPAAPSVTSVDNAIPRSRANTGGSLSVAAAAAAGNANPNALGTSVRSTAGSSVISNGSLLDLYARSPSQTDSVEGQISFDAALAGDSDAINSSRGFPASDLTQHDARAFSDIPQSDSNASIWTTASAATTTYPYPSSTGKRASLVGLDPEVMRSIQPVSEHDSTTTDSALPPVPMVTASGYQSDGSHYDDDEEMDADKTAEPSSASHINAIRENAALLPPPAMPEPDPSSTSSLGVIQGHSPQTHLADAHDEDEGDEVFSNALPSPPVPRRTSSVVQEGFTISPSPSMQEQLSSHGSSSSLKRSLSKRASGPLFLSQIPQRRSSSDVRDDLSKRAPLVTGTSITDSPVRGAGMHASASSRGSADITYDGTYDGSYMDEDPSTLHQHRTSSAEEYAAKGTHSPTKRTLLHAVNEDVGNKMDAFQEAQSTPELSLEEQQRIEKELLAEADDARPRTLKEARERAKLRKQQSEAASTSSPSKEQASSMLQGSSRHVRGPASARIDESYNPRTSTDSKERPKRNPKRVSTRDGLEASDRRSLSEHSAPSDYSHDSENEGPFSYDSVIAQTFPETNDSQIQQGHHNNDYSSSSGDKFEAVPTGLDGIPSHDMDELTNAVNHAMNDLSFGSADDTLSADDDLSTPVPPSRPNDSVLTKRDAPLASARQLTAITGTLSDSNKYADTPSQMRSSPLASPSVRTPNASQTPRAYDPSSSYFNTHQQQPSPQQQRFTATQSAASSPTKQRLSQSQSQPLLLPQQPALPSRIDIYGKNVPLPKSFNSATIIEKRRVSSWERARAYAQCTNELLYLQTGLSLWMEAVQRPAQRQQNQQQTNHDFLNSVGGASKSGHVRGDGSYADSVRSDMTFPMRGDGARAKEIVSIMPTMAELSPTKPPANLPYPGVIAQQRSSSTQSFQSSSSGGGTMPFATPSGPPRSQSFAASQSASMSSHPLTHRSVASVSGPSAGGAGFFSSLGRRNSKRNPGSASASLQKVSQPRGFKNLPTSAQPEQTERPSMEASESVLSVSSPDSTASAPVRTTGLGLSTLRSESTSSLANLANVSASRLPTVTEGSTSVSAAATSGPSGMTGPRPMGPRAPVSSAAAVAPSAASALVGNDRASSEMTRSGSSQSYHPPSAATGSGAGSMSSPAAQQDGSPGGIGFGSGPTFLSRLGGGSFSSSAGGHGGYHSHINYSGMSQADSSSPDRLSAQYTSHSRPAAGSPTSPSLLDPNSSSPALSSNSGGGLRSSFSYGTVRDRIRRGSSPAPEDETFLERLTKLADILPDADQDTLRYYLKKAKGDDLVAIGDYLQDQSLGKIPKLR